MSLLFFFRNTWRGQRGDTVIDGSKKKKKKKAKVEEPAVELPPIELPPMPPVPPTMTVLMKNAMRARAQKQDDDDMFFLNALLEGVL